MCKVKSGAQIENRQDIQNLIIGIIFRQCKPYRIEDILDIVLYYTKNSHYKIDEEELYCLISDSLDMLYVRNKVKCTNGVYTPQHLKVIYAQY